MPGPDRASLCAKVHALDLQDRGGYPFRCPVLGRLYEVYHPNAFFSDEPYQVCPCELCGLFLEVGNFSAMVLSITRKGVLE